MLIQEFVFMTGFYPDEAIFKVIQDRYLAFDGSKQEFCELYRHNKNGIAESIQRECDTIAVQDRQQSDARMERLKKQCECLSSQLEKEQEWTDFESRDSQESRQCYERLLNCARVLCDAEARRLVSREFGFDGQRVDIVHTVDTFQRNRHNTLRKCGEVSRDSLYFATDMNYIRFTCGGYVWEVRDGELKQI